MPENGKYVWCALTGEETCDSLACINQKDCLAFTVHSPQLARDLDFAAHVESDDIRRNVRIETATGIRKVAQRFSIPQRAVIRLVMDMLQGERE